MSAGPAPPSRSSRPRGPATPAWATTRGCASARSGRPGARSTRSAWRATQGLTLDGPWPCSSADRTRRSWPRTWAWSWSREPGRGTAGRRSDGPTALDTFLPLRWLAGGQLLTVTHPLTEWRGTLDWWVFTDGQLGQSSHHHQRLPGRGVAHVGDPGLDVGQAHGAGPDGGPSRVATLVTPARPPRTHPGGRHESSGRPRRQQMGSRGAAAAGRHACSMPTRRASPRRPSRTRSASPSGPSIATSSRWRSTPSCPSGRTRAGGASSRASSCRRWRSRCRRRRPSSWPPGCWPRRPMSTTRSCSSAYVKLAQILPPVLAEHLRRDRRCVRDDAPQRALHARPAGAHQGVGGARVVEIDLRPERLRGGQAAARHPGPAATPSNRPRSRGRCTSSA